MLSLRSVAIPAAVLVAFAGLSGCGSDDKPTKKQAKPSPTVSSTAPSAYLEVPEGITLTEPGTQLALGEQGVVAFQLRQKEVGVLGVNVQRIERTSFQESFAQWNIDDATAARTPYFVRVEVTNLGDTDLGGMRLDNVLWGDDGSTLEAPNYYKASQLPACTGKPLPTPFVKDATAELCQVYYIAPTKALVDVSFTPFGGLDPVTWAGELSPVSKGGRAGKGDKPGKKGENKQAGQGASESTAPSDVPSTSAAASSSATATP